MEENTAIRGLIRRARRRLYLQLALDAAGRACAVLLAGLGVAFLAGTAALGWPFFAVVAVAALAYAAWSARAGIGPEYQTAQRLDRKLGLPDPISTAFYFSRATLRPAQAEVVDHQRREAEDAARSADLRQACPFAMFKSAYASLALLAAAGGIFFLRFGITHRLDLRSPIVHLAFAPATPAAINQNSRNRAEVKEARRLPGEFPAPWLNSPTEDRNGQAKLLEAEGGGSNDAQSTAQKPGVGSEGGKDKTGAPDGQSRAGAASQDGRQSQSAAGAPPSSGRTDPEQAGSSQSKAPNQANARGLMDRMKDAMSDLLSTLKPNANKPEGTSQSKNGPSSQSGAQQQASSNTSQSGSSTAERSAQEANAQGEAGAQSGQKMESASQGRPSDSAPRNDSPDSKSGIGSQDGNKDSKYASELAAMGKISELIGKRSANVTGEVMIEVASGSQELKTQYSDRKAEHADSGGEIDRDEIPLAYQEYVQQYFEQIRKSPAPRPRRTATGASQ